MLGKEGHNKIVKATTKMMSKVKKANKKNNVKKVHKQLDKYNRKVKQIYDDLGFDLNKYDIDSEFNHYQYMHNF